MRAREHRHRRALLLGIAALLLLSLTPVVGEHLFGAAHGPLTGIDHVGALCLIALHLLLAPVHTALHALVAAGALYALADRGHAWWRARRALAPLGGVPPTPGDACWTAARAAGVPPERLRVIDGLPTPAFTAGWLAPRIYVARALAEGPRRLAPGALVAVLAHEGAHLRRRDPLRFSALRAVAQTLFWLPTLRALADGTADEAEVRADDAAAAATDPLTLAGALVALAGWGAPGARAPGAEAGGALRHGVHTRTGSKSRDATTGNGNEGPRGCSFRRTAVVRHPHPGAPSEGPAPAAAPLSDFGRVAGWQPIQALTGCGARAYLMRPRRAVRDRTTWCSTSDDLTRGRGARRFKASADPPDTGPGARRRLAATPHPAARMLRSLSPSALALALGTPAYGSAAVPGPLPGELPPPSARTPHVPMPAVGRPTPHLASAAVGARSAVRDRARLDSVRPTPGLPRLTRTDTTAADSTPADVAGSTPDDFDALAAAVRGPRPHAAATPERPVAAPAPAAAPAATASAPVARVLGIPSRAPAAAPVRLEVSRAARTLVALQGADTLLVAAAGVGTGDSLRFGTSTWRFDTPVGRRRVLGKQAAPVWVPPEWHYAELAAKRGYTLRHLRAGRAEALTGGRRLVVRGARVGVVDPGGAFTALPTDEEIVFGGVLYVPPFGTANRRVPGQLGAYRLDLGDGVLIHGTPVEATVGTPSSHGCLRLAGDALAWVYAHVPVGTDVVVR